MNVENRKKWVNKKDLIGVPVKMHTMTGLKKLSVWDLENNCFVQGCELQDYLDYKNDARYNPMIVFEREFVTGDGTIVKCDVPKTVNDQCDQLCATMHGLGVEVSEAMIVISKEGSGIETRYSVNIKDKNKNEVKNGGNLLKAENEVQETVLSGVEKEVFDKLKQLANDGTVISKSDFVVTMMKNASVSESRAMELWSGSWAGSEQ